MIFWVVLEHCGKFCQELSIYACNMFYKRNVKKLTRGNMIDDEKNEMKITLTYEFLISSILDYMY